MRGLVAHIAASLTPVTTHNDPSATCGPGHQWHGLACRKQGCGCDGPYGPLPVNAEGEK